MDIDNTISQAARLLEAGRRDEALKLLRSAVQHAPDSARVWKWLAYCTPDSNEARRAVAQTLRLTPGDEWARQAWQRLYTQRSQGRSIWPLWTLAGLIVVISLLIITIEFTLQRTFDMTRDASGQMVVNNVAAIAPPGEDVSISPIEEYYSITGDSVESIRRALDGNGPYVANTGKRVIATTSYEIIVNWSAFESGGVCVPEVIDVDLDIVYTYPYLETSSTAPPEIASMWSAFMRRVVAHEEQHGAIAQQCAYDIADAIGGLPSQPDCASLEVVVNQTMTAHHELCGSRQAQFDADVGGESFP